MSKKRKAKTISFINRKGGVGKTTICVNIAGFLADYHNQKVLVIDLDPQASASTWLMNQDRYVKQIVNSSDNPRNTSYQIFRDAMFENENYFSDSISIQKQVVRDKHGTPLISTLDLIPSDAKLDYLENEIVNYSDVKSSILYERLSEEILDFYDYILIDCPPNMGSATQNAVYMSDAFVIPIIADPLSARGFPELINSIQKTLDIAEKRRNDHYRPLCGGIILSHVRVTTKAFKETYQNIYDHFTIFKSEGKIPAWGKIFYSNIAYRTGIPDSQGEGKIIVHAKSSVKSKGEFQALSQEFYDLFSVEL